MNRHLLRFYRPSQVHLRFGSVTWGYIAIALVMGFVVPRLNRWVFQEWTSPVDQSTLTGIFSAIASGMITLSGLVFSLLFVLVQFGSATYSPRITRIFSHAHVLRHSLGIFTGTFLYSLMAMRTIGIEQARPVSGPTIWLGFAWLLGSIAILAKLIGVFTTLTVTNVLTALGRVGRRAVDQVYPRSGLESGAPEALVRSVDLIGGEAVTYQGDPGYVIGYDTRALLALAARTDTTIELPYAVGDAVKDGAPLATVYGTHAAKVRRRVGEMIVLGRERAFVNDPKYAIRLLVDTAIRALSPAINDPTTAVQALDHIESLLRRLGNADLDVGRLRDATGALRVVVKTPTWDDYLELALSEIMLYGAGSIQVHRRLEALLTFLGEAVPVRRAEAVIRFAQHRRTLAARSFDDATFRAWAQSPDREGIGSRSETLEEEVEVAHAAR